jgi:hypothetical protein
LNARKKNFLTYLADTQCTDQRSVTDYQNVIPLTVTIKESETFIIQIGNNNWSSNDQNDKLPQKFTAFMSLHFDSTNAAKKIEGEFGQLETEIN